MAGGLLGGAKDWMNKNLGGAGDWIDQHKGPLLGGLGLTAGAYLLHKMMAKKKRPRPQGYTPYGPMITAPQAFEKAGGMADLSLTSLSSPTAIAEMLNSGSDDQPPESTNMNIGIESQQLVKLIATHPEFRHALKQAILKR